MEYKIAVDNPDILVVRSVLTETDLTQITAVRRFLRVPGTGLTSDRQRRHSVL